MPVNTPEYLEHLADRMEEIRDELIIVKQGLWKTKNAMKWRERQIIPKEGWPGKNVQERKVSRDRAILEDKDYQVFVKEEAEGETELIRLDGAIDNLIDRRRATEYSISYAMAEALNKRHHFGNPVQEVSGKPIIIDLSGL